MRYFFEELPIEIPVTINTIAYDLDVIAYGVAEIELDGENAFHIVSISLQATSREKIKSIAGVLTFDDKVVLLSKDNPAIKPLFDRIAAALKRQKSDHILDRLLEEAEEDRFGAEADYAYDQSRDGRSNEDIGW